ncbi:MAG: hypothetical protein AMQ22_00496 [Candidatus Methanofastidiosum methylothiophilum]|uniref:Uncharacterized protein n=1 Tax=Candidatus Methanofastidiosum methylothiophilum TaxID=1705564 RepID=A0A150J6R1_9EURY|nr:MAG: hypothetical protein AMQ22_00496 [Candidatus Methanofastidiosum methylthiophilus]
MFVIYNIFILKESSFSLILKSGLKKSYFKTAYPNKNIIKEFVMGRTIIFPINSSIPKISFNFPMYIIEFNKILVVIGINVPIKTSRYFCFSEKELFDLYAIISR